MDHFKEFIRHYAICNKAKYNRHPQKEKIEEAPIPNKEIYSLHRRLFKIFGS